MKLHLSQRIKRAHVTLKPNLRSSHLNISYYKTDVFYLKTWHLKKTKHFVLLKIRHTNNDYAFMTVFIRSNESNSTFACSIQLEIVDLKRNQ